MTVSEQVAEVILQTKKKFPQLRIGQIVANASRCATKTTFDPYHVSDADLLSALKEMLESYD